MGVGHDHGHGHGHGHSHGHGHDHGPTPTRALAVALVLNAGFLVVEAVAGWWLDSLALLADAGHMVSDVGALAVALAASRIRDAAVKDPGYTFGLRRAPVLGGLFNGVTLVVVVIFIGLEATERFTDPPPLDGAGVLVTGVLGLAVNLVSAWYLARSRDDSVNTRGAMLHLLADALGSVAAIVAALAVIFFSAPLADPIASLLIAALIFVGTLPLLRDTVRILLQRAPASIDLSEVRAALLANEHVRSVEDLHVWELDSRQPVLSAVLCVECSTLSEANVCADGLRKELEERFGVEHATIECRHADAAAHVLDF